MQDGASVHIHSAIYTDVTFTLTLYKYTAHPTFLPPLPRQPSAKAGISAIHALSKHCCVKRPARRTIRKHCCLKSVSNDTIFRLACAVWAAGFSANKTRRDGQAFQSIAQVVPATAAASFPFFRSRDDEQNDGKGSPGFTDSLVTASRGMMPPSCAHRKSEERRSKGNAERQPRGQEVSCRAKRTSKRTSIFCRPDCDGKRDRIHDVHAVIIDEMADEDTAISANLPTHMYLHSASVVSAGVAKEEAFALTWCAPTAVTFSILPPAGILEFSTVDATTAGDDDDDSCWTARSMAKSDMSASQPWATKWTLLLQKL